MCIRDSLRKILHNGEHRKTVRFAETMLSLPRRLKWAKDVVAALDLLHSRAVVHRDLKPGNVLISNKGDAVLSDFGLSRVREAQQSRLQVCTPSHVCAMQCSCDTLELEVLRVLQSRQARLCTMHAFEGGARGVARVCPLPFWPLPDTELLTCVLSSLFLS